MLEVLAHYQLFAKISKWQFATCEIEYLGHIVSKEGVQAYPKKLEAITN